MSIINWLFAKLVIPLVAKYVVPFLWKIGPRLSVWYANGVMRKLSQYRWYWSLLAMISMVGVDIVIIFQHAIPVLYDWILVIITAPFVLDPSMRTARKMVDWGYLTEDQLEAFTAKSMDLLEELALLKANEATQGNKKPNPRLAIG